MLWAKLKRKNLGGHKFRRQYSINEYVIDFYCPSKRLAIEIDGDSHFQDEAINYDFNRQKYMESFGIKFLRFKNSDVYNVAAQILCALAHR